MSETSAAPPSRVLWSCYFAVYGLTWLLGLVFGDHAPMDIVLSIFFGMGIAGLWGYINESRIGVRPFWIAYFVITMSMVGYAILKMLISPELRSWGELWALVGIAMGLSLPQWIALWRYAFRSPQVWGANAVA